MTLWHEELKQQLEQLPSGTRLQVHDIPSVPETCSSLIANNSDKYTQTRRLILIMAQSSGGTNAIVCGMEAIEYKTVRNDSTKWTVYISKVDTTGYPSAKNITAIMIRTYLSSFGPCRVHVFACAQPQYLFRDSAKYQEKKRKTLTDRALIGWWRSVFSHPDLWKNSQVKGWWSIPGIDDEREAIIATGNRQPVNSTASWQYGYPYDPKAKVNDVIPQFEDDTKARLSSGLC
ncbi:histone H3-K56 acetyltransferase [Spinellus fusiger]|nr:histone H3-K56 acetyltransferase [Spinellus fusiger]